MTARCCHAPSRILWKELLLRWRWLGDRLHRLSVFGLLNSSVHLELGGNAPVYDNAGPREYKRKESTDEPQRRDTLTVC